jgi:hypothetical protein
MAKLRSNSFSSGVRPVGEAHFLIATGRSSISSMASHTRPSPPAPSGRAIR